MSTTKVPLFEEIEIDGRTYHLNRLGGIDLMNCVGSLISIGGDEKSPDAKLAFGNLFKDLILIGVTEAKNGLCPFTEETINLPENTDAVTQLGLRMFSMHKEGIKHFRVSTDGKLRSPETSHST